MAHVSRIHLSDLSQALVATNTAVILLKSCKIEKSTGSKRDENMLIVLNACDANLKINTSFFPVWSHRTQIGCIYFHTKRECPLSQARRSPPHTCESVLLCARFPPSTLRQSRCRGLQQNQLESIYQQ